MSSKNPLVPYKRVQCRHYENGFCNRGESCGFAHGLDDVHSPSLVKFSWPAKHTRPIKIWVLAYSLKDARKMLEIEISAFLRACESDTPPQNCILDLPVPATAEDITWWRSLLGHVLTVDPDRETPALMGSTPM